MATTASAIGDSALMIPPATVAVRATSDARRLDSWVLALTARGIPTLLRRIDGVIALHVLPMQLDAARVELDAMDAEELEARRADAAVPSEEVRFHSRFAPLGGALFALLLVGFYLITGPSASRSSWFVAGASDAARVIAGEWWRAATALVLHADSNHVLANVAIGSVVVTMVMRRAGVGFGAGLVVLAGTLGNLVNAWAYGAHHSSIGFSTAVFGAIGILGGLTYVAAVRERGTLRGRPAWIAIAATMALLAMLGASERSDMLAHLFGTFAGVAVGFAVGVSRWRPRSWLGQAVIGAATVALVVGAWALALAAPA